MTKTITALFLLTLLAGSAMGMNHFPGDVSAPSVDGLKSGFPQHATSSDLNHRDVSLFPLAELGEDEEEEPHQNDPWGNFNPFKPKGDR